MDDQARQRLLEAATTRSAREEEWYLAGYFRFETFSEEELVSAEQRFGQKFPWAFRLLLAECDSFYIDSLIYCHRFGVTVLTDATSLWSPRSPRAYDTWFEELAESLEDYPTLGRWARNFLPIANGHGGTVLGLDLGFDPVNPPVVLFDSTYYPVHRMFEFVVDDLQTLLELPRLPGDHDGLEEDPCSFDTPVGLEWCRRYDALIDNLDLDEHERERGEQYRTPHKF